MMRILRRILTLALAIYFGSIVGGLIYYAIHNGGALAPLSLEWLYPLRVVGDVLMAIFLLVQSRPPNLLLPSTICLIMALVASVFWLKRSWPWWVWMVPFACFAGLGIAVRETWRVG